jgi:hypothetical protein
MAQKLSSRQVAQLEYLQTLPQRFQRIHAVIEEMSALRADDVVVRGLTRLLDEMKAKSGGLSLTGLADTAGLMSTMARRGGGLQMKVRGLRELFGSLKINYEAALRSATTPEAGPAPEN